MNYKFLKNLVGSDWVGGTHISYSGLKQMLILVNAKKGSMSFFDLRKNNIIRTLEVFIKKYIFLLFLDSEY